MTGILNLLMGTVRSAVVTDPYFEYTTLLLPGSGTNGTQNNSFVDSSANAFPITRNPLTGPNAPTQGTFSPFSQTGWGNYFNGSSAFGTSDVATDFQSGDFTIEAWVYLSSLSTVAPVVNGSNTSVGLQITTNAELELFQWTGSAYSINIKSSVSAVALNTWVHVVGVRSGSNASVYVNGSRLATSTTVSGTQVSTGSTLVGRNSVSTRWVSGYISNLRIVKGTAVYDPTQTTLTVPTSPLTAITNTSLLTCQSNRFIDNSTNNYSISLTGTPTVVAFSPFNPTASWSAATYGGSGYFDGSGDYLTSSINAIPSGSTPFTVEAWIYPTAFSGTSTIFGGVVNITEIQFSSTGISYNKAGVTAILSSSTALTLNAWNHIAVVRNGSNNSSILLNGVRLTTTASDSNTFSATTSYIGSGGATQYCFGYLSNFRFVVGTAVYDPTQTTYTVPTAPLTAITNTSLLLNFTNAGIYDATSKNDLETVGDAQISNTTAKWGSTSIKFDGTGDYLQMPDSELVEFGSADFTIEAWVYPTLITGANRVILGHGTSGTQWLAFYIDASGYLTFAAVSSSAVIDRTATSRAVSLNTWTHVAVSRSGSTFRLFIDGSEPTYTGSPSTTSSAMPNFAVPFRIGAQRWDGDSGIFQGYIQDMRITKYARYTANFTPPTAAFPTL